MKPTLAILVTFVLLGGPLAYGAHDGDFQYWNSETLVLQPAPDWQFALNEAFRFRDNRGEFFYQHSELRVIYSGLPKWFEVGAAWRFIFEKKKTWLNENRPALQATLKGSFYNFRVSNRSMFEYRIREKSTDYWRYRNKTTLRPPFKMTRFNIQPYGAEETFFDFESRKMNRHRVYAGVETNLLKHVRADIFYMIQASTNGDWEYDHIVGTEVKFYL